MDYAAVRGQMQGSGPVLSLSQQLLYHLSPRFIAKVGQEGKTIEYISLRLIDHASPHYLWTMAVGRETLGSVSTSSSDRAFRSAAVKEVPPLRNPRLV